MPDVPKGTPMTPARLEWTTGESYIYKDEKGFPIMVPRYDPALEEFVLRHTHGYPDDKVIREGIIKVWSVDQKTWDNVDITTKVRKEIQELTGQWYQDRDEFKEEALKCYNRHGNPDMGNKCPDFMNDDRRIGKGEYKDDNGNVHKIPNKFRQYLCYMCPYMQAHIATEVRFRKGLYK